MIRFMNEEILVDLHNKAQEFSSIASLVNESSRLRKAHSEDAITLIKQCREIGDILNHEFEIISRWNRTMRDQDSAVRNCCVMLDLNMGGMKEIVGESHRQGLLGTELAAALEERIGSASESITKALGLINEIVLNDSRIILLDSRIISRKKLQGESIERLKRLAYRTLEDTERAIRGSSANLERGNDLAGRLKDIRQLIDGGNIDELQELVAEAGAGRDAALNVNRSSVTQLEFARQVNRLTRELHEESISIRDLITEKHGHFMKNLELAAELAVLLSLELMDFLPAQDLAGGIALPDDVSCERRNLARNLAACAGIACRDIRQAAGLKSGMTESIGLNADLEKKSIDQTKIELECFGRIRAAVESMSDATVNPIEGSIRNIENGKRIENYLREIIRGITEDHG